jgi:hypothetical protein
MRSRYADGNLELEVTNFRPRGDLENLNRLESSVIYRYSGYRVSDYCVPTVEGEKTGDGISYASHVKNPNPLKARATTFYDPVHNALDKEV